MVIHLWRRVQRNRPKSATLAQPSALGQGVLLLALGLSLSTAVVVGLGRVIYSDGYVDPFQAFEQVMPGQPAAALDAYPCDFHQPYLGGRNYTCVLYPTTGRFHRVLVGVDQHEIVGVTFSPDDIWVFDLIQRWGPPDHIRRDPVTYFLHWDEGVIAITHATRRRFSPQLKVKIVTVSARPDPVP